ncbi:MAG: hypothetical protein HZB55_16150 [Deltaproteobacteria bacterium]|nr:hypothetical protein [Deltaproteobacteria bacterium]
MNRRWCVVGAALVTLAGTAAAPRGALDPHAFLSDRRHCMDCHADPPRKGVRPRFKKDVVALCLDCHREKDLTALHPVDVRPGSKVPRDLPLDERGAITCATCHNPHQALEAEVPYVAQPLYQRLLSVLGRGRRYRTFYLRRRNDEGQLCLGCHQKALMASEAFHVKEASVLDQYVGSDACRDCHAEAYREWKKTAHARMTRDARRAPGSVVPDFGRGAPFPRDDVVYVLGSHWTQRYVVQKAGRLQVKGATWSLSLNSWDTSSSLDKPWAEYCQGCHTTGFEMQQEPRFSELGVGCEACHGPGRGHVRAQGRGPIVNPAKLDQDRRDMICESCHTNGHDRSGQFRFPLGFRPGKDLTRYYRGLLPKAGQDNASFTGDESYEDRHRQWLFWVDSVLDVRDVPCDACGNFRNKRVQAKPKPKMTVSEYCLSCHRGDTPKDETHRRHAEAAVPCHRCHGPLRSRDGAAYRVHDHKFLFGTPEAAATPSPAGNCTRCHSKRVARAGR